MSAIATKAPIARLPTIDEMVASSTIIAIAPGAATIMRPDVMMVRMEPR